MDLDIDLECERERAERIGVRVIERGDLEWPTQLADLGEREPHALWCLGTADLRLTALQSVSIVGSRDASRYGLDVTHAISSQLALRGRTIISGGAFGIDAAAHRGALAANAPTVCVVAGGVDVVYPRAHHGLFEQIRGCGVIVSEHPIGTPIRRHAFLPRNRLIAALGRVTVVVESAIRSGSLNTAREATELNRVVCAVPGSVHSAQSAGCHQLIRDGRAFLVANADDVLAHLGEGLPALPDAPRPIDALNDLESRVLDAMPSWGSTSTIRLAREAGCSEQAAHIAVATLSEYGFIRAANDGFRLRR